MTYQHKSYPSRQAGFGLVEIMVGLVIGMIVSLIIVQVMLDFDQQKRSTSGGSDAQTNGGIALHTVQADIQSAGFGLPGYSQYNTSLNCNPQATITNPVGNTLNSYPITIVDGGAGPGASDQIIVRSAGGTNLGMAGVYMPASIAGNVVSVTNNMACNANDTALVITGNTCDMERVVSVSPPATPNQINLFAAPTTSSASGEVTCVGVWTENRYQVSPTTNRDLQVTTITANDAVAALPVPAVSGIVNIQAQYGLVAAEGSLQVVSWVDATGAWAAPTSANNNLIRAVRIAIVARNGEYETAAVTTPCSSLNTPNPTGLCAWAGTAANPAPNIDLSVNVDGTANPDWDHFRYRVYETIVPIRNVTSGVISLHRIVFP